VWGAGPPTPAHDVRATNDLLYGCFQPGTTCSNQSAKNTGAAIEQLRQTQFTIAVCQRLHPITEDPDGEKLVACVQAYYPTFVLPPKVHPSPRPSRSGG
jgi:hypothetical protein